MKTTILLVLALLLISVSNTFSQYTPVHRDIYRLTGSPVHQSLSGSYIKENYFAEAPKKKSIWIAAVLSALVPGAGEFYAKNYLKAAIFLGVEALSWGSFAYFQSKGNKKTGEFQTYANTNWNVRRYARWLREEWDEASIEPNDPDLEHLRATINAFESTHFSHSLPEYGDQQYYEVIGKYQNYVAGWADAENESGWIITKNNYQYTHTAMFDGYSDQRQKANNFYNYASTSAIVVIANHLLSAADAAWTVSVYNKKFKMETGFRLQQSRTLFTTSNIPTFNLKLSF